MKNKTVIFTISSMLFYYVLNYGLNFFLTAYVTKSFGIEVTGFINLAKSFTSYASIITMAVNSFAVRYIVIAFHDCDNIKVNQYCSSVLISDIVIGLILLMISVPSILWLESYVNISPTITIAVKTLFAFAYISFFITIVETVFTIYAYAKNVLFLLYLSKIIGTVSEILVLFLLFRYKDPQIWYVGLGGFFAALLGLICNFFFSKKWFSQALYKFRFFSFYSVKELVGKGIWNSVNQLGNVLNSGLDLYFSNILFDSISMGNVSIAKTVGLIPSTIYTTMSNTYKPKLLGAFTKGNTSAVIVFFKKSIRINCLFMILVFSGFVTMGKEFYNLWIPGENIELIYRLTIITLLTCVIECGTDSLTYTYTLTLKNKFPCAITVLGGLINAIGMVILSKYTSLGIYSIVITTFIVMGIINIVTNPIYVCKCLRIPYWTFYPIIIYSYFVCAVATGAVFIVNKHLHFSAFDWKCFIIKALILGFIGGVTAFVFLFFPEKIMKKREQI